MSNFAAFMAGNAKTIDTVEYVVSKRFVEKNEPIKWVFKPIGSDLDESLRKECTKKVPIADKRGQYNQETDTDKYIAKMCVACTVYPNLNDAELQDSYGVKSGEELLRKMLLPGEYTDLKTKIMEINGYDLSMEELVDEAKN